MSRFSRAVPLALGLALGTGPRLAAQPTNDLEQLAAGNTTFALDLHARLKSTGGNLFFSPYSLSTCLAMTFAGARGATAAQMARTLHFDPNPERLAATFGELQAQLNHARESQGIELAIANGLWARKDQPLLPAFLNLAQQNYAANLQQVDFRNSAEAARTEINDWVGRKTAGKIPELIPRGLLAPETRLVLVNAIYFKGRWARAFDRQATTPAPFAEAGGPPSQVPFMRQTADFGYAETAEWQLLELPYVGGDTELVVLLPKDAAGLPELEARLDETTLARYLAQARNQKVEVWLPRFKLTAQFSLARTLAAMGMTDAFSPRADFSGLDGGRDLYLSAVVHKAYVEVNEEGTEAAAATGVMVRHAMVMRPRPTPVFRADHPFLFLIRDRHSGSLLFLGRLAAPTPT